MRVPLVSMVLRGRDMRLLAFGEQLLVNSFGCAGICCGEKGTSVTRRLTVWLAGAAVLLTVLALVGCVVATTVTPVKAAAHPGYTAGTACDATGCHNTYKHKAPYLGPCENCHTLDRWKPAVYKHKNTSFDNGMHPLIGCAMCHTEGEPLPSKECSACHESPHGGFKACANCHTTNAWGMRKPLPETHVSLLGGHKKLECFDCHKDTKPTAKTRTCTDCHGSNHGGLTNCQDCHDPSTGWNPKDGWNHDVFFKRVGAHAKLDCGDCHKNGRFANTPRVCVGCHGKQHGGLTDCGSCHSPSAVGGFKNTSFRHSSVFNLTGRHAKLDCTKCHAKRQFARVLGNGSHKCVSCHGSQHGGLTDCASCHTTSGFGSTTFSHAAVFPLEGRHATLECDRCHLEDNPGNRTFLPKPSDKCVDCHGAKHGGLTDCADCHTTSGFGNTTFSHAAVFPLVGTHATLECVRCHLQDSPGNRTFLPKPSDKCVDCHGTKHGGQTQCQTCHSNANLSFIPALSYTALHPIPIGGTHADTSKCTRCHPATGPDSGPVFNNTVPACETCHAATIPHVGPTDCVRCHQPTSWSEVHFTHSPIYFLPGVEAPHPYNDPIFGPYPTGCVKCHPSSEAVADFTHHRCSNSECH